jgi:hypothetical protein
MVVATSVRLNFVTVRSPAFDLDQIQTVTHELSLVGFCEMASCRNTAWSSVTPKLWSQHSTRGALR